MQDDVRLLGLITLCISRSEPLPSDLLENLNLHRESVDILSLALLHSRSFSIASLLSEVAPQLSEISRTFEALITYINILSDPTICRANVITKTSPFIVTPWPSLTTLMHGLVDVAGRLHNYHYQESVDQCEQLLKSYPSCPELRSLYALSIYFAAKSSDSIANSNLDFPDLCFFIILNAFSLHLSIG